MIIKNHIPILLLLTCCWAAATAQQVDIGAIGKGNALLASFNIANVLDTPQQKGATLDSDDFADGERVNIAESANFFKIVSEAGGKMGTLLKDGTIEESTYLSTTKAMEIIHAPPLVTGTIEAATRALTDITGTVVLAYDLGTDAKARQQTWQGLKQLKDQIANDSNELWTLLGEALLEEASGNWLQDWQGATKEGTDPGKQKHLYTKGAVRTASSIFLSGKLILRLPEIAADLVTKMARGKGRLNIKEIAELTETVQEKTDELLDRIKNLPENGKQFLDDFSDANIETIQVFLENPKLVDSWSLAN